MVAEGKEQKRHLVGHMGMFIYMETLFGWLSSKKGRWISAMLYNSSAFF
jgi:hypothetical protein